MKEYLVTLKMRFYSQGVNEEQAEFNARELLRELPITAFTTKPIDLELDEVRA